MGKDFDRNRLLNNINILIANKKLKKSEIEVNAGVSAGYLSRLTRPDNDTIPGVDFIYKIAEELGVTIDALLNYDFSNPSDNMLLVSSFIQEIIKGTDKLEFEWDKSEKSDFEIYEKIGHNPRHPLCWLDNEHKLFYNSHFYGTGTATIAGTCYKASIDNSGDLYLMNVGIPYGNGMKQFWELYIIYEYVMEDIPPEEEYNIIPICCTYGVGKELESVMNDLVNCIERHEHDLKLSKEAREAIGMFMTRNNLFPLD